MLLFLGNFDNEVIEKEDWSTEHPNLENEALETCLPFKTQGSTLSSQQC